MHTCCRLVQSNTITPNFPKMNHSTAKRCVCKANTSGTLLNKQTGAILGSVSGSASRMGSYSSPEKPWNQVQRISACGYCRGSVLLQCIKASGSSPQSAQAVDSWPGGPQKSQGHHLEAGRASGTRCPAGGPSCLAAAGPWSSEP